MALACQCLGFSLYIYIYIYECVCVYTNTFFPTHIFYARRLLVEATAGGTTGGYEYGSET